MAIWGGRHTTDDGAVRLSLPVSVVAGTIIGIHALLFVSVLLEMVGISVPLVRPVVGFVYVSVLPGALLLRFLRIDLNRRVDFALYAVGLSLFSVMAYGTVVNFALHSVGVAKPLSTGWIVGSMGAATLVLTGLYYVRYRGESEEVTVNSARLYNPTTLSLLLLPFLGIYGALLLTAFTSNILLLILYAAVATIPVLVLVDVLPRDRYVLAIWTISLALLLQNTLTGPFLAWGDQPKEANIVMLVLERGLWDPTLGTTSDVRVNKYMMLRLGILHPIHKLVTGVGIVPLFKIVHPLLFSITPVALYRAYEEVFGDRTAFLGAFLYMSLFSFFVVLSRNTRTATALLFLALLLLLIVSTNISDVHRKLLAIPFALSIAVSHYGVSYVFLLGLLLVVPAYVGLRWLSGGHLRTIVAERAGITSAWFVFLYAAFTFSWYIYAAPQASTFRMLIGFGANFVHQLQEQFLTSPSESATVNLVARSWESIVMEVLVPLNLLIGLVIGIGILATVVRRGIDEERIEIDAEYLTYASVFMGVFGITFLPVERFNTARTYPISLLFFAPFLVVGVRELTQQLDNRFESPRLPEFDRQTVLNLAGVVLLVYFLLNSGFVSAVAVHEYSPNVLVEKGRVMDEGRPAEAAYFYKQYPTRYEAESSTWLLTHAEPGSRVYVSGWPGGVAIPVGYDPPPGFAENRVTIDRTSFDPEGSVGRGYVFLGPFSVLAGVIRYPGDHFVFRYALTKDLRDQWADKNRVYSNGGSVIYH